MKNQHTRKIAIIGGGPKGMYGFERLASQFKSNPPQNRIEIHIYNRSDSFGAGDNYNINQPSFLLINNPIGDINIWPEEKPASIISNPQSLTQWLRVKKGECVTAYDYESRAIVGRYLRDGFESIATNLPPNVFGKYLVGDVSDIFKIEGKFGIKLSIGNNDLQNVNHRYDHILLATGHPKNKLSKDDLITQSFASSCHNFSFIPSVYPTDSALSNISPGSCVAIKGLGLTFIDAVLALTEGKGGTFHRDKTSEKLVYHPSGLEPKVIYPFSRSGLPMIPRKMVSGEVTPLKFFTRKSLLNLRNGNKIDFIKQILPLLKKEMIYAFYEAEFRRSGFSKNLSDSVNYDEVQHMIADYHEWNPKAKQFDPDNFISPLNNQKFADAVAFNHFILSYLIFYVKEAQKGEINSPWAAVTAVWRKVTPLFGEFYSFGGLTPDSHRYFDRSYRGRLNRVTFGPPVESAQKIVALMESGILNFKLAENPNVCLHEHTMKVTLESKKYNLSRFVHYLVDARISKVSLTNDCSLLYRNLLDRGLISIFENRSGHDSYKPGCVAISREGYVIDEHGAVNYDIAVTGTPTEGITFDNDSLSRDRNNIVSSWAADICNKHNKSTLQQHAS